MITCGAAVRAEEQKLTRSFEQAFKSWRAFFDQAASEATNNTPEEHKLAADLVLTKAARDRREWSP